MVIDGGDWVPFNVHCYMVNVYAPQDLEGKQLLWDYLRSFIRRHRGNYIIFGDFNVVSDASERYGSNFCQTYANVFDDFIGELGLVDVSMTGKRFTRVDSVGAKLSKLERFLVSEDMYDRFEQLQVKVLDSK